MDRIVADGKHDPVDSTPLAVQQHPDLLVEVLILVRARACRGDFRSVSIVLIRPLYHRAATAGDAFRVYQAVADRIPAAAVGSMRTR